MERGNLLGQKINFLLGNCCPKKAKFARSPIANVWKRILRKKIALGIKGRNERKKWNWQKGDGKTIWDALRHSAVSTFNLNF